MNDLSGFGKCSLTAAIPVLSALGVQCCPLPSAVLTNQTGYPHYHFTDLSDMLTDYIDAWEKNGAHFDGIYSGFMMSSEQINSFIGFLNHFYENDTFLLVDPVMGDDGRMYSIYSPQPFNPSLPPTSQLCQKFIIANINNHQSKAQRLSFL